ncbi:20S proteasome subunit beta 4 [Nematocida sp. LUAm3]|nr:20S proteasome subunit beta 4 [Nematocida sp. LUAm3]KAI5175190.1 20S proteasome subunit beta 4 [Nematocida sp. LUAm2]KAI5178138.1 20S proteasome subunit beta 4 [Nematocida sp. LUAm1]
MEVLFGVATREYVILASDTYFRNNVVISKSNHIRYRKLDEKIGIISSGDQGDSDRTVRYLQDSLGYHKASNYLRVTERTAASYLQDHIHSSLRSNPLNVSSLIGGFSEGEGKLFSVDNYGALTSSNYLASGYSSYFFLSYMDKWYHPDMPVQEAIHHIKEAFQGVKNRLVVSYSNLHLCVITKEGISTHSS